MCGIKLLSLTYCFIFFQNVDSNYSFTKNLAIGSKCKTTDHRDGICKLIEDCPILFNVSKRHNIDLQKLKFLKKSHCGYDEDDLVCCGNKDNYYSHPVFANITCGYQETDIINYGEKIDITEFPWLALLEHHFTDRVEFSCTGSLISSRYVLTAASCIVNPISTLTSVRLGGWNRKEENDCVLNHGTGTFCADYPVDIEVERAIVHELFVITDENRHYDIGLIRLKYEVKFSKSIRPICLPPPGSNPEAGEVYTVAVWENFRNIIQSDDKRKLQLPIFDHANCTKKYGIFGVELQESQLCAGGESYENTCKGDGGGPLMKQNSSQWYVEGIVSFGRGCGKNEWPDVFTKVSSFIDWIYLKTEI